MSYEEEVTCLFVCLHGGSLSHSNVPLGLLFASAGFALARRSCTPPPPAPPSAPPHNVTAPVCVCVCVVCVCVCVLCGE
jgi:hypothetical protein